MPSPMMSGASGGREESDNGADPEPESNNGKNKRSKGKSKVWERMSWFSRKSKSKDSDVSGEGPSSLCFHHPSQDLDGCPSSSSSSSNRCDICIEMNFSRASDVAKPRMFPNSEIVETSCLKPSVARALFMRLEAVGQESDRPPKYSWQKKRKAFNRDSLYGEDMEEPLSRTLSMPDGMGDDHVPCHCVACCRCSPFQRLQGSCPVFSFIRRSNSIASLDTALNEIESSLANEVTESNRNCPYRETVNSSLNCARLNGSSHLTESSTDPAQPGTSCADIDAIKCNSLPTYFSHCFLKKCKNCGRSIRISHLPLDSGPFSAEVQDSLLSAFNFCQCKHSLPPSAASVTVHPDASPSKVVDKRPLVNPFTEQSEVRTFREKLQVMSDWFKDFNNSQRNAVLKQFLSHCDLPQMHLLSTVMEPRLHAGCPPNCCDGIGWLPVSIATYLLTFLDPVSLCNASMTCHRWHELASDPSLWRRFCNQPKWRLSCVGEQKQLLQHVMPNGNIDWKEVFAERYKLCNNWLKGRCNVRTFEGHTQGISCVQFDDTRIVSGSSDKTIKVWNIRTNSPWAVQTLAGHSGTVRCLHLDGNRLVSGSTDRTIKVWDLSTQQSWSSIACKVTMVGHLDTVRCLQVDDEKVLSGSYDKCLKVWDIRTGHCRMSLRGHEAAVLCVQFDKTKIVSGSCDRTIKVWNFLGECLMTLRGHHDAVTCLQFDQTRIISGSLDCNLKFWHISTGQCLNTIDWKASEGHTGVVRCLQADSWRVVSASDDRTIKVWSLETGQRLVTLRNHTDGVTCLQFNDSIIVSGSYDKTVKLWDFGCC